MASIDGKDKILLTEPDSSSTTEQPELENGGGDDEFMALLGKNLEGGFPDSEVVELGNAESNPLPTEDPYTKAVKYMEMHNVMQLFQHLTSQIVYHRPIDPLNYMLEELQRMKDQRDRGTAT